MEITHLVFYKKVSIFVQWHVPVLTLDPDVTDVALDSFEWVRANV